MRRENLNLKPIAAIGHPPTQESNGNGCCKCPPKRQNQISPHAQHSEQGPKDLSLHLLILVRSNALRLRITMHLELFWGDGVESHQDLLRPMFRLI